eukprot:31439-Pelagococcus_subviridis.AAC.10
MPSRPDARLLFASVTSSASSTSRRAPPPSAASSRSRTRTGRTRPPVASPRSSPGFSDPQSSCVRRPRARSRAAPGKSPGSSVRI